jgi:hypothetical protein
MNETQRLREVTQELSQLRQRPCLVLYVPSLHPCTVRTIHEMLGAQRGQADVVIRSPGGCLCCAYQIARELRRRFDRLGMFVPLAAKSAATLIALAADELVLGDLGELGPLDGHFSDKQRADFPVDRSRLEVFSALDQVKKHAIETFDELARTVSHNSGMRGEDVCRIATEFAARICEPLYAQLTAQTVGQSVRVMEMTVAYAERVLRRYRPDLYAQNGSAIIERLVRGYADHGFVIDREELAEIGIPARNPTAAEAPLVARLASALEKVSGEEPFIELIDAVEGKPSREAGDRSKQSDREPRMAHAA